MPVYVCAECGDLGCGAVTVELTVHPEAVTWSDWGFQTNYEEEVHKDGVPSFGTLTFDRAGYEAVYSMRSIGSPPTGKSRCCPLGQVAIRNR